MPLDYSKYSRDELHSARASIDPERYPENAAALSAEIAAREAADPEATRPAEPRYASGWRRFGALWVDGFVLLIPNLILMALAPNSAGMAMAYLAFASFTLPLYQVFFHARTGATPGKKALRIRVLREDLSRIGLVEALKRSSVDALLGGARAAAGFGVVMTAAEAFPLENLNALNALWASNPVYGLFVMLSGLWAFSEILTCLFNRRRRALHDFIAGTVVVVDPR